MNHTNREAVLELIARTNVRFFVKSTSFSYIFSSYLLVLNKMFVKFTESVVKSVHIQFRHGRCAILSFWIYIWIRSLRGGGSPAPRMSYYVVEERARRMNVRRTTYRLKIIRPTGRRIASTLVFFDVAKYGVRRTKRNTMAGLFDKRHVRT